MTTRRSKKLKDGIHTYEILWLPEKEFLALHPDEAGAIGLYNHALQKIHIRLELDGIPLAEPKVREVLLHEVLHWQFAVLGLYDEPMEEQAVTALARGVLNMFHYNPWLKQELGLAA